MVKGRGEIGRYMERRERESERERQGVGGGTR